jgi:hypothetical protein
MTPPKKNSRNATPKRKDLKQKTIGLSARVRETILIIGLALSCFLFAALIGNQSDHYKNFGGWLGSFVRCLWLDILPHPAHSLVL